MNEMASAASPHCILDSLPDEILLKILQYATSKVIRLSKDSRSNFLLHVISKVSRKFEAIATVPLMWKIVKIDLAWSNELNPSLHPDHPHFMSMMPNVTGILKQLGDTAAGRGTKKLIIDMAWTTMSTVDMTEVGRRFQYVETMFLNNVSLRSWPWPTTSHAWTSLNQLHIFGGLEFSSMFKSVDFHFNFPNLSFLKIEIWWPRSGWSTRTKAIVLPDLSECSHLKQIIVALSGVARAPLSFPCNLGNKVPLPRSLKELHLSHAYFVDPCTQQQLDYEDKIIDPIKSHLQDCKIISYEYPNEYVNKL